jgi:hypothetical protein
MHRTDIAEQIATERRARQARLRSLWQLTESERGRGDAPWRVDA